MTYDFSKPDEDFCYIGNVKRGPHVASIYDMILKTSIYARNKKYLQVDFRIKGTNILVPGYLSLKKLIELGHCVGLNKRYDNLMDVMKDLKNKELIVDVRHSYKTLSSGKKIRREKVIGFKPVHVNHATALAKDISEDKGAGDKPAPAPQPVENNPEGFAD